MPLRMCRNVKWVSKVPDGRIGWDRGRRDVHIKGCNGAYENHRAAQAVPEACSEEGSTSTIRARSTAITVWGVR